MYEAIALLELDHEAKELNDADKHDLIVVNHKGVN